MKCLFVSYMTNRRQLDLVHELPWLKKQFFYFIFIFLQFFISNVPNVKEEMLKCSLQKERATYFHSDPGRIGSRHSAFLKETKGQSTNLSVHFKLQNKSKHVLTMYSFFSYFHCSLLSSTNKA